MITESVSVSYQPIENVVVQYGSITVLITVTGSIQLIFDRTYADVANRTEKGFYNASDLNRVGNAVSIICASLRPIGIEIDLDPKVDWVMEDEPTNAQMEKYLADVRALQDLLAEYRKPGTIPEAMSGLTVVEANDIERALDILYRTIESIIKSYRYYSGMTIAGVNAL